MEVSKVVDGVRQFLVSRLVVSPLSIASRASRGYLAVEFFGQWARLALLKGTWGERDANQAGAKDVPVFFPHRNVLVRVPTQDKLRIVADPAFLHRPVQAIGLLKQNDNACR